jgi:hypothetical protein
MKLSNFTRALILTPALILGSCQNTANKEISENEQQWVSVAVEVSLLTDTTDYYYYGQMDADKIQRMNERGSVPMFFTLKNIRYWNDSDKLEIYEDSSFLGKRMFLTKDLVKIDLMKDDPVLTYKKESLTDRALAFRSKQSKAKHRITQGKK